MLTNKKVVEQREDVCNDLDNYMTETIIIDAQQID